MQPRTLHRTRRRRRRRQRRPRRRFKMVCIERARCCVADRRLPPSQRRHQQSQLPLLHCCSTTMAPRAPQTIRPHRHWRPSAKQREYNDLKCKRITITANRAHRRFAIHGAPPCCHGINGTPTNWIFHQTAHSIYRSIHCTSIDTKRRPPTRISPVACAIETWPHRAAEWQITQRVLRPHAMRTSSIRTTTYPIRKITNRWDKWLPNHRYEATRHDRPHRPRLRVFRERKNDRITMRTATRA